MEWRPDRRGACVRVNIPYLSAKSMQVDLRCYLRIFFDPGETDARKLKRLGEGEGGGLSLRTGRDFSSTNEKKKKRKKEKKGGNETRHHHVGYEGDLNGCSCL